MTTPPPPPGPTAPPAPPWAAPPDPSMHVLRWVILALGLALGLVLLVTGHLLVGGLITVMVVLRMVMFTKVTHRRRQAQEWRRQRAR